MGGGAHALHMEAPPQPAPRGGVPAAAAAVAAAGEGEQSTREPPVAGGSHTSSPKSSRCSSVTEDAEIARIETLAEDEVRAADKPPCADAPTTARADETSAGGPGPDLAPDLGPDPASSAVEVALACQGAACQDAGLTSGGTSLQGVTQAPMQGPMPDSGEFEVCLLCARHGTAIGRYPPHLLHPPHPPHLCHTSIL